MSVINIANIIQDNLDTRFVKSTGRRIKLIENDPNAGCKQVVINSPKHLKPIVLEIDQKSIDIHPLFADGISGLKKKNDYIIICPYDNKLFFLIIDLKSDSPKGWTEQCMAGEYLIKYVIHTLERVYNIDILKHSEFRHLLFSTNDDAFHKSSFKKKTSDRSFKYLENSFKNKHKIKFIEKPCNRPYADLRIFLV